MPLLLGATAPLNAVADVYSPAPFTGWYAGVGVGIDSSTYQTHNTSFQNAAQGVLVTNSHAIQKFEDLSPYGAISAGYGFTLPNCFYLGVDAFLDFAQHSYDNYLNAGYSIQNTFTRELKSSSLKTNTLSGGIAIEPGFMVAPCSLLYGIIGWVFTNEDVTANYFTQITTAAEATQSVSTSNGLNGLRLGLGIRHKICPSMALGLKYQYTNYFNGSDLNTIPDVTTGANPALQGSYGYTVAKPRLTNNAVLANINYYWDNCDSQPAHQPWSGQAFEGCYAAFNIGAFFRNVSGNDTNVYTTYSDDTGAFSQSPIMNASLPNGGAGTLISLAVGSSTLYRDCFYLALEGSLDWAKRKIESDISQGMRPISSLAAGQPEDVLAQRAKLHMWELQPNLDLKFGRLFKECFLGYVRVGMGLNQVDYVINDQLVINQGDPVITTAFGVNDSNRKDLDVFLRLGLGGEYQFSACNTFTLNYIYTDYGKYGTTNSLSTLDVFGNPLTLHSDNAVKVRNHAITFGLTHYF